MADKELVAQVKVTSVGAEQTKTQIQAIGEALQNVAGAAGNAGKKIGGIAGSGIAREWPMPKRLGSPVEGQSSGSFDGRPVAFKTNADKVKADIKKIEDSAKEAELALGHVHKEADGIGKSDGPKRLTQNISETGSVIDRVGRSVSTLVTGIVAAMGTSRLVGFVEEAAFSFRRMGAEVGVSDRMIQAWTDTAEQLGLEASTLVTAVGRMQDSANDIMIDPSGQTAQNFRRLGISVYDANGNLKDANELLYAAADAIKAIDNPTQRTGTAIQLFGRAGRQLVPILSRGSDELRRMNNEFASSSAGLTSSQIDKTIRASVAYNDIKDQLLGVAGSILEKVAPGIEWLSRKIEQTIPHIQKFFNETTGLRAGIIALGIAATIAGFSTFISWMAAAIPFVIIGLAILAVGLAIDDLIGTMQGADSDTRRLIDSLFGVGSTSKIIDMVKDAFFNLKDMVGNVFDALSTVLTDAKDGMSSFKKDVMGVVSSFLPLQVAVGFVAAELAKAFDVAVKLFRLSSAITGIPGSILGPSVLADNPQAGPDTVSSQDYLPSKASAPQPLSAFGSASAFGPVARPIESPVNVSRPQGSRNANATTNASFRIEGILDPTQVDRVFRPIIEKAISDSNNATANAILNGSGI